MKLQIVINETYDEKALINIEDNTILAVGDQYHEKIDEYIEGFLDGLDYLGINYTRGETLHATPDMEIFDICTFYDGSDD